MPSGILTRRRTLITPSAAVAVSQVVTDAFTGVSTTNISAHTSDSGHTWSYFLGTGPLKISSTNDLFSGGTAFVKSSYTPPTADYSVQVDLVPRSVTNSEEIIFGRLIDSSNFFRFEHNGFSSNVILYKMVAGTLTSLGTSALTLTAGVTRTLKLEMIGTAIKGYIDGVQVISVTEGALSAAGQAGLGYSGSNADATGIHMDNFAVFA